MSRPIQGLALIEVNELHPSPNNPRQRLTGIEELAASIWENGLIQPLVVQKIPGRDGFQIVAGHRRHAAARQAKIREVPCIIRRDMLPDEELLAMIVENNQRTDLDPIEEARALKRLKDAGMSDADVARKIGRSTVTVANRLMLLTLPLEEQEAVRAGHYTLKHATGLVRSERKRRRQVDREGAGQVGRPKGAKTKPYFGDTHPLAGAARAFCDHNRGVPKVGGVACGPCWEAVIRTDALQVATVTPIGVAS